jgi:hypothetical protein
MTKSIDLAQIRNALKNKELMGFETAQSAAIGAPGDTTRTGGKKLGASKVGTTKLGRVKAGR